MLLYVKVTVSMFMYLSIHMYVLPVPAYKVQVTRFVSFMAVNVYQWCNLFEVGDNSSSGLGCHIMAEMFDQQKL